MVDPLVYLSSSDYGSYSRSLARKIGVNSSVLLSELLDRYVHASSNSLLVSHHIYGTDLYQCPSQYLQDRSGLSRRELDTSISLLQSLDILYVYTFGVPPTRHFRFNVNKLLEFLSLTPPTPPPKPSRPTPHPKHTMYSKCSPTQLVTHKHKNAAVPHRSVSLVHPQTTPLHLALAQIGVFVQTNWRFCVFKGNHFASTYILDIAKDYIYKSKKER